MVFNAAKDLVYTMNGGNISSGGYRISNILNKSKNGKSKNGKSKNGKQTQETQDGGGGGGYSSIFKEDSGIPIGLLLMQRMQRLHFEPEHPEDEHDHREAHCKNKEKKENGTGAKLHENKKLVYASIENDDDDRSIIELVITPSGFTSTCENPIEISSNEIDHELYDSLVESVLGSESAAVMSTPFRKTKNATKKQNFGKHKDIEKVYQKRKTRSKRHH
jgi:hypothetical protein